MRHFMHMLTGKIVVVLGGNGSIGSAVADACAAEGADVIRHGFGNGEYDADVSSPGALAQLLARVGRTRGGIHVIVNAVSAPLHLAPLEEKTWEDFLLHLNVQLRAAVDTTGAALPLMKKQREGVLVHIITAAVSRPIPPTHMADYVTAKYALLGFARASEAELRRFGIRVIAAYPLFIDNAFTREMPAKAVEMMRDKGETTTPEQVAGEVRDMIIASLTAK